MIVDGDIFHPSYSRGDSKKMRKHTFFSHRDIILHQEKYKYGSCPQFEIFRYGDLVSDITFVIDLLDAEDLVDDVELALIKSIELTCGSSKVDKITNDNLYQYHHFNRKIAKRDGNKFIITIPFFMNRIKGNFGHYFPLISCQYHYTGVQLEFESLQNLTKHQKQVSKNKEFNVCVFAKFIYLNNIERKRFAQVNHEYLMTQNYNNNVFEKEICNKYHDDLKKLNKLCSEFSLEIIEKIGKYITGNEVTLNKDNISTIMKINVALHFKHPIKSINIAIRSPSSDVYFNYKQIINRIELNFDGHKYVDEKGLYLSTLAQNRHNSKNNNIYSILFSNNPHIFQPSGCFNLSRIDKQNLFIEIDTKELNKGSILIVTSENYNVLYVESGMAGLRYN